MYDSGYPDIRQWANGGLPIREPDLLYSHTKGQAYVKVLLDEIDRLNAKLTSLAAEFCPHIGHNEHGNKYCLIVNRTLPTTAVADGIHGLGEK